MIAVFDIDGVLADARHREHHVSGPARDWDAFFAAVGEDPPIDEGIALLRATESGTRVVLVSGRPERTRADTEAWLARNGVRVDELILRPDADRRPAATLKAGLLRALAEPSDVACVVDDDPAVVDRLVSLGYPARLFTVLR